MRLFQRGPRREETGEEHGSEKNPASSGGGRPPTIDPIRGRNRDPFCGKGVR
jgi:hypothetical protein